MVLPRITLVGFNRQIGVLHAGLPVVRGHPCFWTSFAWFECKVIEELPAGDHTLIVGKAIDEKNPDRQADLLIYSEVAKLNDVAGLFPDKLGD